MATRAEEASGCVVVKTIGDCAYGTESNRVAHADAGRELVAKLPRTPKGALLTKAAFAIDVDAKTVTCPEHSGRHSRSLRHRARTQRRTRA